MTKEDEIKILKEHIAALEGRLAAADIRLSGVNFELGSMRQIISDSFDVLSRGNESAARDIRAIHRRLDPLEEHFASVFAKVFPDHDAFLDAFENAMRKPLP